MRLDCRIVAVDLVEPESRGVVDGSNDVEAEVAGLFPGFGCVERYELEEIVNPLWLYLETDHNHVHKFMVFCLDSNPRGFSWADFIEPLCSLF